MTDPPTRYMVVLQDDLSYGVEPDPGDGDDRDTEWFATEADAWRWIHNHLAELRGHRGNGVHD